MPLSAHSQLRTTLEAFDKLAGKLADTGYVDEAWKIRGFVDGLFQSVPECSDDGNYMIGFDHGTDADGE